jgi:hypothetical protein
MFLDPFIEVLDVNELTAPDRNMGKLALLNHIIYFLCGNPQAFGHFLPG